MHSYRKIFLVFIILSLSITINIPLAQEKKIAFAIAPMASPASNLSIYSDFINYLSNKIGYEVVIIQRRTYAEINSLLETGEAQFAFISTGAFLSGSDTFGLEPLAVPVRDGKTSHNSYIIVNKENKIDDFLQLKGKVFAFSDPLSFTGRLYPLHVLKTMGVKPKEFFEMTFFTSSHEKSIESVANGLADGAAVDSLIFNGLKRDGVPFIEQVKVIKISPPYGMPPIVASPLADNTAKQRILRALIKMAEDPAGREVLDSIEIEKYIRPSTAIYRTAVKLRQAALLP